MTQAVPLARDLRVEGPLIVVDGPGRFVEQALVEDLALEKGTFFLGVQGPVQTNAVCVDILVSPPPDQWSMDGSLSIPQGP